MTIIILTIDCYFVAWSSGCSPRHSGGLWMAQSRRRQRRRRRQNKDNVSALDDLLATCLSQFAVRAILSPSNSPLIAVVAPPFRHFSAEGLFESADGQCLLAIVDF
jgi:hypothetical protein